MNYTSHNARRFYLTSTGRISYVEDNQKLDGECQARRELLGNDFPSAEEAALARSKIEARARIEKYALTNLSFDSDNNPVIERKYIFPDDEKYSLMLDLELLIGCNQQ